MGILGNSPTPFIEKVSGKKQKLLLAWQYPLLSGIMSALDNAANKLILNLLFD